MPRDEALEGAGHGFVDVYNTDGTLLNRIASQGASMLPGGWRWHRRISAASAAICSWGITATAISVLTLQRAELF